MESIAKMLDTELLPDWFPDEIVEDAWQRKRELIRRQGMTPDTLREAIEEIIAIHHESFADPNYTLHEHRSATIRNGKPDFADTDRAVLARYMYAATVGEEAGLPLLIGNNHAGRVIKGDNYGTHQGKIASNPRGRIGDAEQTNDQIIGELAMATYYRELSANELWDHYHSHLGHIGCDPKADETNNDWRRWTIEYDFKDGRKSITGGQFANVVSKYRNSKKSG